MNVAATGMMERRRLLATAAYFSLVSAACSEFTTVDRPNYGYIRVTVESSGGDLDPNGFVVVVRGQSPRTMGTNATPQSFYVSAGTHEVALEGVAENCAPQGTSTRTVSVELGMTTEVRFEIVCVPTAITVTTRTTGADAPNSLNLVLTGLGPVTVASNGSQTVGRLTAGSYAVTLSVPANCTVSGGGQVVVTVVARTVTSVPFDITCVAITRLEKIAFVGSSNPPGLEYVTVVNVDGTMPVVVGMGQAPAWSPDGRLLAYTTTRCSDGGWYYWYYYSTCDGGVVLLDPETKNETALTRGQGAFHPAWAPNGAAIALGFLTGGEARSEMLAILHLSTSTVRSLDIAGPVSNEQPTWSPDGLRIAFVCRWPANADLCVVNGDGGALVRLTDDVPVDLGPKWRPDGRTIAYARHPVGRTDAGSGEIVLIDVATRQQTVLTNGADPAWSPDGSRLVFARDDGLFVIDANGANLTRLTTGSHRAPAWRP